MARRISVNVNGDALENRERFLEVMAKVRPDAICVMNNPRFAMDVYEQCLNKGGTFFYRTWDKRDTEYHLQVSPQLSADMLSAEIDAWEKQLGTTLKDKWTFIYRYNEPAAGDIRIPITWIRKYMEICARRGISISAMEWAVAKSMNQAEIKAGHWDDYLRDSHLLRKHVKQTTHDYSSGVPWLDVSGADILNLPALHPDRRSMKPLLEYMPDGSYESPLFHMGREIGVYIKRAKELGFELDWYWIESFADEMNDIPHLEEAKRRFPYSPYSPMKGVFGHKRYYDALLGHTLSWDEFADFCALQAIHLDKVMPANCKGMMAFTAATGTEWDVPHGCNLWDARIRERYWSQIAEYHDSLETVPTPIPPIEIPPKEPPMPLPSNTLIPMRAKSTHALGTNLRAEQSTTSAILTTIPNTFVDVMVSDNWNATAKPEWVKIQYGDKTGYSKQSVVVIEDRPIVIPPPVEEPEYFVDVTGGGTVTMKQSVLDALIAYKRLELAGLEIIRSGEPVEQVA
jgi:hypothetical protein